MNLLKGWHFQRDILHEFVRQAGNEQQQLEAKDILGMTVCGIKFQQWGDGRHVKELQASAD